VVTVVVVIVMVMAVVVVIVVAVVVAMVFVIPVAFMYLPALLIVVVVGVGPVGAGVGWALPDAGVPDVVASTNAPVAVDPRVTFSGHGGSYLIANWRGRRADIDLDLAIRRYC
jgi:hypothetical protein